MGRSASLADRLDSEGFPVLVDERLYDFDIDDMIRQLRHWLGTAANVRCHGKTGRIVIEHFREEQPQLQPLPADRIDAVLRIERCVSHEGRVSVGDNYYSVPNGTEPPRKTGAVQYFQYGA